MRWCHKRHCVHFSVVLSFNPEDRAAVMAACPAMSPWIKGKFSGLRRSCLGIGFAFDFGYEQPCSHQGPDTLRRQSPLRARMAPTKEEA